MVPESNGVVRTQRVMIVQMDQWGDEGQRAARLSLWLDFGYMTSYGVLLGLLVERRRRQRGHPAWLPAVAAVAVVGDAIEGISLLRVLGPALGYSI